MPCYTRTQTQVTLGVKTDKKLLTKALEALSLSPAQVSTSGALSFAGGWYDTKTGQLTLSGSNAEQRAQQIKRAYGAQVAQQTAVLAGWQVKAINPYQFDLIKGS